MSHAFYNAADGGILQRCRIFVGMNRWGKLRCCGNGVMNGVHSVIAVATGL